MDSKVATSIAFKIFSIYIMVHAIMIIPTFFKNYIALNAADTSHSNWLILIAALAVSLLIALAIFIWTLAIKTATKFSSDNTKSTSCISETFILSVLGLYLIFDGLTKCIFTFTRLYFYHNNTTSITDGHIENIIYLIVYSLQIIIGISLVIKTNGWESFLNTLRDGKSSH